MMYTDGAQCTANFVYYDASNVYLGQAAHCSGTGSNTDTNGCTSGSRPIGTPVKVIRAVAPTGEVKNRIWDQVKLVDATFSDLTCDISVSQQQRPAAQAPATMTAGASVSGSQNQRHYTVRPGDTLSKISREFYGDASQFTKIFNANRNILRDPNTISPGQELVIPE